MLKPLRRLFRRRLAPPAATALSQCPCPECAGTRYFEYPLVDGAAALKCAACGAEYLRAKMERGRYHRAQE